jgi:hypothetical protein
MNISNQETVREWIECLDEKQKLNRVAKLLTSRIKECRGRIIQDFQDRGIQRVNVQLQGETDDTNVLGAIDLQQKKSYARLTKKDLIEHCINYFEENHKGECEEMVKGLGESVANWVWSKRTVKFTDNLSWKPEGVS